MITIQQITDELSRHVSDPVQKYIFVKEIKKAEPSSADYINAYEQMKKSKHYRELADEQWENGSWVRFHTQDTKAEKKQKFATTESALCRANELSLSKDDTMIAKCIKLMERYVRGEETWTDWVEKHKDGGKGHMFARPYMTAARINMFDPENPFIQPLKNNVVKMFEITSKSNFVHDNKWEKGTDDI